MTQRSSPTALRRQLARKLRELREVAGLTNEEASSRLAWSRGRLSRIENEQQRVQPDEVEDMLDVYGVDDATERTVLIQMAKQAKQRGWWQQPRSAVPEDLRNFVGMEAAASRLHWFELALVPGLLQTPDYARALIIGAEPCINHDELERRIAARMTRQEALTRKDPVELHTILDESVLHRRIGGSTVMGSQLRHLVKMSALPNVTVQVVPATVGAYPGVTGWFMILEFPGLEVPDMGYTDGTGGNIYLEDPEDVRACALTFTHLKSIALQPTESVALIESIQPAD